MKTLLSKIPKVNLRALLLALAIAGTVVLVTGCPCCH